MAGGHFLTTCSPNYVEIDKVIAPFGTTLDCDIWRRVLGTYQMAQYTDYADCFHLITYVRNYTPRTHSKFVAEILQIKTYLLPQHPW
jgi:hypothetical protein